jgi:DNA-binding Xre family transcriptional regulator
MSPLTHDKTMAMQKITLTIIAAALGMGGLVTSSVDQQLNKAITVDSLGACQGISCQKGSIFYMAIGKLG